MRIVKHIENLLLKENSVIVPDFGCFMAHSISAHYDETENIFLPPQRTLGFNPRVTINDSLLVQSYIETYSMSYPDAMKDIENEVAAIKEELGKNGKFTFEGVGILRFDGKTYDFTPCASGILTPSIYGLDSLEITSLKAIMDAKHSDDTKVNAILKPSFTPSEEKKKSIFAKESDEPIVITIQRATLRKCATAAAVLALAALSFIPMKYAANASQEVQQASVINVTTEKQETAKVSEASKVSEVPETTKAPEMEKAPEAKEAKYAIVLAEGISPAEAKAFADDAKKEGVAAEISSDNTSVVFGKYASRHDARSEMKKHRGNHCFKDAKIEKL